MARTRGGRRYESRQLGLGDLAAVDLETARALAVQAKAAVGRGEDPARASRVEVARQVEERRHDRTTSEVAEDYCAWVDRQPRSAKYRADEKRQVERAIELAEVGGLPLREVRRGHLVKVLDAATGPALPRKLLGSFGRFLSLAPRTASSSRSIPRSLSTGAASRNRRTRARASSASPKWGSCGTPPRRRCRPVARPQSRLPGDG